MDYTIKVWCRQTWACLRTLTDHTSCGFNLVLHDGKLFSTSDDETIKIWDTTTWACVRTLDYEDGVYSVLVRGDTVVAGCCGTGTIVVKNIATGETVSTLAGHSGLLVGLSALSDGRLISASDDKTLKVWA